VSEGSGLEDCLRHFPGAVLAVSERGIVCGSNGRLEARRGGPVLGRDLSDLLEPGSREKWQALLAGGTEPARIELAFDDGDTYRLRAFVALREKDGGRRWLLEQPAELSEAGVHEELAALNQELAGAHRQLGRERARLERALAAEAEARAAAESSRRLLAVLEGIGEVALGQSELQPLLEQVLERVQAGIGVEMAAVLLLEDDGRAVTLRAARGLPEAQWPAGVPIGVGVAGRVAASRQPMVVEDLAAAAYVNPAARERLGSLVAAPMIVGERLIGVLEVASLKARKYSPEEVTLVRAAAGRLASVIDRQRLWEAERAARATAQDAVRQRDEVLAIVAHDLRNPLNRILLSAAMLKEETGTEMTARALDVIRRAVRGMDNLVRDLLDVSRLEAGGLRLERSRVPVPALVAELVDSFEDVARSRGVQLEGSADEALPEVEADRQRLLQALSNLLDNALRLTPAGGAVAVAAARAQDYAEFRVRDTGPGMPAEQVPHLFDRFWQGSRERRGGAGLGLSIVKGIVEAHGGRIFVETAVGQGTTFRLWIPLRG
jgi:signal transduction histidine kinase